MSKEELEQYCKDASLMISEMQHTIDKLERQIKIKDKWCQLLIDIGFDYDGFNQVDSLKGLIDELVIYAERSIKNDDTTPIYVGAIDKTNILGEVVEVINENKM